MKKYLSLEERKIIQQLHLEGKKNNFIAFRLGRAKYCIWNDINRYEKIHGKGSYDAEIAHELAQKRIQKRIKTPCQDVLQENQELITELIENGFSQLEICRKFSVSRQSLRGFLTEKKIINNEIFSSKSLESRICALEMQVKILTNQIRIIKNGKDN